MKKVILTLLVIFAVGTCVAQNPMRRHFREYIDLSKYVVTDSLPLERIYIHSPFDYDDDTVIDMGDGDYLIEIPHKDKMIIKFTKDKDKAIVIYNSFVFGRHKEFKVKDNKRRLTLWFDDGRIRCGYVYDKYYKVCKYFEAREYITNEP